MRALILLAAIVLILALVGWLTFSRDDGRASINLETQEIRQDTQQILESGSEALQRAGESVDSSEADRAQPNEQSDRDPTP